MAEVKNTAEHQQAYKERYAALGRGAAAHWPAPVQQRRAEAWQAFGALGYPTTRDEDWQQTNLAPLTHIAFSEGRGQVAPELQPRLQGHPFFDLGGPRLVFVNGVFSAELSALENCPAGVTLLSLNEALASGRPTAAAVARHADFQKQALTALNTALFQDGALIEIGRRAVVPAPLQIVYVSTGDQASCASFPRTLIVAAPESQATIVETYLGFGMERSFTNAVTEIVAEANAWVEHCRVQQEGPGAIHISAVQTYQTRDSRLSTHSLALGGELVRNGVNAVLDDEGAEVVLNGLYVLAGQQHCDNHTVLDHAKPNCRSREYYKGILDDQSSSAFNGLILVRKDAQHTDAIQSNKNLILSADATANTRPQLEIYADDVRCTHGATVGQIDAEMLFYMRSRGVGEQDARHLLTYAFANDVLQRIQSTAVRERLEAALFARWNEAQAQRAGQAAKL